MRELNSAQQIELLKLLLEATEDDEAWEKILSYLVQVLKLHSAFIELHHKPNRASSESPENAEVLFRAEAPELEKINCPAGNSSVCGLAARLAECHPYVPTIVDLCHRIPSCISHVQRHASLAKGVVVELGYTDAVWFALWVVPGTAGRDPQNLRKIIGSIVVDIRRAWAAWRQVTEGRAWGSISRTLVADAPNPEFYVSPWHGCVANGEAEKLLRSGLIKVSQDRRGLRMPSNLEVSFVETDRSEVLQNSLPPHRDAENFTAHVVCSKHQGRGRTRFVGTLVRLIPKSGKQYLPWEHPRLDPREQFVMRIVAETGLLKEIGGQLGVSEKWGRKIFKDASRKLGGISRGDLKVLWRTHTCEDYVGL